MRILITSIILLFSGILMSQLNDAHIYVNLKEATLDQVEIKSLLLPNPTVHNYNSTEVFGFDPSPISPNTYKLNIEPKAGFIGDITTVIEYFEPSSIPGIPNTNYVTIHFKVKSSKIELTEDYLLTNTTGFITPLSNDSTTDGPLEIVKLGYTIGATATIDNDSISYTLTDDRAQILYFAKDAKGNIESSEIILQAQDAQALENYDLFTDNVDDLTLILPDASYEVNSSPSNGSLTVSSNPNIWQYSSNAGYVGADSISFTTSQGGEINYNISVLNKPNNSSFVIDDYINVIADGTVTFDVRANDLKTGGNLVHFSPELTHLGNGVFSYSPPTGFIGDKLFEYKIFTGFQLYTGFINIHVDQFSPVNLSTYNFEIVENQTLRVIHNSPVGEYTFYTVVGPNNGTLEILNNNSFVNACETIEGPNTIIYEPAAGFVGLEELDIEYETDYGFSEIVKLNINVIASSNTACLCVEDCVFAGDHNDDGKVDVKDILDLGLNIGEAGVDRTNDFNEIWTGQYSNNWGFAQMNSSIDLKCGDSDGDGYIDLNDLNHIITHYGNSSRLQAEETATISDIPIIFIPQSTSVDSGELLVIDIAIGDSYFPALDLKGSSFSFNMDPEIMDSASVNFYLYEDNWFEHNSEAVEIFTVPEDGQIDIAISRISRTTADGFGIIGALEFIVEDEVTGVKRASYNNINSFIIDLQNIISVNQYGDYVSHPNHTETIKFNNNDQSIKESESVFAESLNVFPNPTADILNIGSHFSGIDRIEILDALGRNIQTHQVANLNEVMIDISNLAQGTYILKVQSGDMIATQLISKID